MNKSLILSTGLLLLPLVACNTEGERAASGECPAGETCSAETPYGLHFLGTSFADQLFVDGPAPTAIGGTQNISLEYDDGDGLGARNALDLPYDADDDGGLGVQVVTHAGPVVTVKAVKSRSNYLRITDPATGELFDRYSLTGAAVSEIDLIATTLEVVPVGAQLVWGPGTQRIAVAIAGDAQAGNGTELRRLVDTSMVLDLPGATRRSWDTIELAATPGVHTLSVTAGDKPATQLPVEVVAAADAMPMIGSGVPVVQPHSDLNVCFEATNAGRYVVGLTWQFEINGAAETHGADTLERNCILLDARNMATGTFHVTASAGGQHVALDVPVATALAPASVHAPLHRAIPTAGDRAAL